MTIPVTSKVSNLTTNSLTQTETLLRFHIKSSLLVVGIIANKLADERQDCFKLRLTENLIRREVYYNIRVYSSALCMYRLVIKSDI